MSIDEIMDKLDYDYRKAGTTVARTKILLALNENNYEKALDSYEGLERKIDEYLKEETSRSQDISRPIPPKIILTPLKALIDFHFGKISKIEFKNIINRSNEEYMSYSSKRLSSDLNYKT